ncbi:RNA polymerase sigma factor [Tunicatimonas pelagia]|uniref:RNA polymerase sigma factor n=1 Tax=Tunicatimonas pelagia TaxID=931531 RepID=UPI00266553BC|nr:sigma-70 family RNA polymerase sigma factor [Tunicatimonas pelagia]WKN40464.1 sigma-70 family RNA polymerase sigma factor [Tunicatimonas pelagia]
MTLAEAPVVSSVTKETLFTRLYLEGFPAVARFISRKGGTLEEAQDVFQEALLVYYERVVIDQFEPARSDKAYVLGISKNIWLKGQEKSVKTELLDDTNISEDSVAQPTSEKLWLFLQGAGKKCMDLLQSFYYERLSMKELSGRFGFGSERSATVQKYKCLEKVREQVKVKSLTYEDFVD